MTRLILVLMALAFGTLVGVPLAGPVLIIAAYGLADLARTGYAAETRRLARRRVAAR
jgi:hypothetical protein